LFATTATELEFKDILIKTYKTAWYDSELYRWNGWHILCQHITLQPKKKLSRV